MGSIPSKIYYIDSQHRAARFVSGKPWRRHEKDSITNMLNQLKWATLEERRKCARLTLLYKILHK